MSGRNGANSSEKIKILFSFVTVKILHVTIGEKFRFVIEMEDSSIKIIGSDFLEFSLRFSGVRFRGVVHRRYLGDLEG